MYVGRNHFGSLTLLLCFVCYPSVYGIHIITYWFMNTYSIAKSQCFKVFMVAIFISWYIRNTIRNARNKLYRVYDL